MKGIHIQTSGYPADEGASLESLTFRQNKAPNLFQGYYLDGNLIGVSIYCCPMTEVLF